MKNILKTIAVLFLITLVSGCGKDFFDVNTPTSATDASKLSMNDLLGPVIYHTIYAQYDAERTFGNYVQNFVIQGGGAAGATSISGTWSNVYLYVLPNIKVIEEKAQAVGAKHFDAVAKILTAMNLGIATDSYENIPYSEAAQGAANLNPVFDSQESIYNAIFSLLNSAIAELEGPDNSGFAPNSKSDLIYQGDLGKWLRAAYTLKARYKLHLINKIGATQAAQDALTAIAKGFTSNADDFQMIFDEKHINPWYSREVLAKHTGNSHDVICDQLVEYMDGRSFPFKDTSKIKMDPRLPVYAQTDDGSNNYKGYVSGGQGISGDSTAANTDFREEGYYTNATAPIVVITYAEAMFIKAEAEFLANGGTTTSTGINQDGYDAYLAGIKANFSKLGVSSSTYIADSSVSMGAANLQLKNIMKEKYIANFLNPETYVDMRRYDFSTDVFPDLALPLDNDQSEFPGKWLVRAQYPSTEAQRNPDNVTANQKSPDEPVWWMK
ncbi:MAG TPA: SusD/RagB family nutrient-binding outer membrane lipoprotein [Bacteroidetes bacterium]|nr:SusD/RagB family nutrient-binding outer membrane lipoprotein [Bacteroidota bacterium]